MGDLTNTDQVMRDTFWVGVHPSLTETHLAVILLTRSIFPPTIELANDLMSSIILSDKVTAKIKANVSCEAMEKIIQN